MARAGIIDDHLRHPGTAGIRPSSESWSRELLAIQSAVTAAGDDTDRVMHIVTDGALRLIPDAAGAAVQIREGDELVYRAASGWSARRDGLRLPLTGGLAQNCMATGKTLTCLDSASDPRPDLANCRNVGIRSIVVVPLPLQGEYVGVLKIYAWDAQAFDERDLLTARLLAGPIAIGLASAAQALAARAHDEVAKRFAATFEQAAVGIAHVAPDGSFLLVNDRFCDIAGHARDNLILRGFQQITHPDDLDADLDNLAALVAGKISHYAMEKRYVRDDGSLIWVNLTVSLVRHADGTPDFFVSVIEDISARKQAEQAALHDALTGLPNRRWMIERLDQELDQLRTGEMPLSVAYLDLDGFKAINDRFGHAEGDRCLIEVAAAIKSVLRDDDMICRMAGDEFVLLLPHATQATSAVVLGRLHHAIERLSHRSGWPISVSAGAVVVEPGTATTAENVLSAADRIMYVVKHGDRRRQAIEVMRVA